MELVEGIVVAIIISVTIQAVVGGFWHWLGSRELRKGFEKMDERFEALLKESSEAHTKILEAIKEAGKRRKGSVKS